MYYPTDADADAPWNNLLDYQKLNLINEHYELFGMTRAQAEKYLFKIPPTEPEVMKSFQDIGVFGFTQMKGDTPVGTVYRSSGKSVGLYRIKSVSTGGHDDDYPKVGVEYYKIDISDFEIPIITSDMMLDLWTRHRIRRQRASEMRGFYEDVVEDTIGDYAHVVEYGMDGNRGQEEKESVMIYVNAVVLGVDIDWDDPLDASELVSKLEQALLRKTGVDVNARPLQMSKRWTQEEDD